jgi:hypothetical protein
LKAIEARTVEAQARAHDRHVRVIMLRPESHYKTRSQTDAYQWYELIKTPHGWTCGCKGWTYTGCCKHLGQLARRAMREGWTFGAIARPPQRHHA